MSIEIDNLILLLAAAQGLFLAVLIFHKHGRLFANRFLGALILMFSLILVHLFLSEQGYEQARPLFSALLVGLGFLVSPLHYLYARFLVRRDRPFRKKDWLHFFPFLIYEGYRILQYVFARDKLFALFGSVKPEVMPFDFFVYNWAVLLQGLIYVQLTIRILNRYARHLKEVFSSLDKIKLDWLRNITFMFAGILVIFLVENVLMLAGINFSNYFSLSSVLAAVYVYALGYLGLSKSEIFVAPKIVDSISHLAELSNESRFEKIEDEFPTQKYEKSGLSEEKAKGYLQQLLDLMATQQPYTNSELTLNQLAEMLSISSLLAIAFDAGFNSKSSFNLIFKKQTNLTPSEYRKQAAGKKS